MKFILVLSLIVLAALPLAKADGLNVPEIHVSGLSHNSGANLTVLYVAGHESIVGASGHDLIVNQVHSSATKNIAGDDVVIPAQTIAQSGFVVVNNLVLVVHQQPNVFLKNPNGVIAADPRIGTSQPAATDLQFIRKGHISLQKAMTLKSGNVINIDFNRDLE
jgi:hypothetical protein